MRVAIVDDDLDFAKQVKESVLYRLRQAKEPAEADVFGGAQAFLCQLAEKNGYDLCLLDVEMPKMDGLALAKRIWRPKGAMRIAFLTSHEKYAVAGYRYHACDYILKEEYEQGLAALLPRLLREAGEESRRFYAIRTNIRYERFLLRDILYVTREGKNAVFHCREAEEGGWEGFSREAVYRERAALADVYGRLPAGDFLFIDRGQIVNLRHVEWLRGQSLGLANGLVLPVSRNLLLEVKRRLAGYWGADGWNG